MARKNDPNSIEFTQEMLMVQGLELEVLIGLLVKNGIV